MKPYETGYPGEDPQAQPTGKSYWDKNACVEADYRRGSSILADLLQRRVELEQQQRQIDEKIETVNTLLRAFQN